MVNATPATQVDATPINATDGNVDNSSQINTTEPHNTARDDDGPAILPPSVIDALLAAHRRGENKVTLKWNTSSGELMEE